LNIKEFTDNHFETLKREVEKGFDKNLYISNLKTTSSIGKKEQLVFESEKNEESEIVKFILYDNKMSKHFLENRIKDIILKIIFKQLFSESFLLPAERTGLNLFYRELGRERTMLLHHLQKPNIDMMDLVKDLFVSRYPQPIGDYIDFLNDIHNLKKLKSPYRDLAKEIQKEILPKYSVKPLASAMGI